jgi:hypothetical protein
MIRMPLPSCGLEYQARQVACGFIVAVGFLAGALVGSRAFVVVVAAIGGEGIGVRVVGGHQLWQLDTAGVVV